MNTEHLFLSHNHLKILPPSSGPQSKSFSVSHSVVCDSSGSHGWQPARILCPWDFPGKNTGMSVHALFKGIFLIQGLNLGLPHCRQILYHLSQKGITNCSSIWYPLSVNLLFIVSGDSTLICFLLCYFANYFYPELYLYILQYLVLCSAFDIGNYSHPLETFSSFGFQGTNILVLLIPT